MKKLVSISLVLIVLCAFTATMAMTLMMAGCAKKEEPAKPAEAAKKEEAKIVEWKMISTWTPAINLIEADRYFAKLVGEMSGGRFKITLHPAPELVPPQQVFDAISKGSFPIGGEWPNYWAGKNSAFDLLGSYPMGMCQYDYVNWFYHGGGKDIYNWLYGKYNAVYLTHGVTPMESGIRTNVPIKSLADYKGKKLRMSGKAQGHILKKLGASQVMLAGAEIYQALQLKTIDGAEFNSDSCDWGMGFGEVTKFNIGPGWHQPSSLLGLMINKDEWNKLSPENKRIIEVAAQASCSYMSSWFEHENTAAIEKFKKKGTQIFSLKDADLKVLEGYSWEYLLEEAKNNPDFLKVAVSMFQYLKDFQVTRAKQAPFGQGRNLYTVPNLPGLK